MCHIVTRAQAATIDRGNSGRSVGPGRGPGAAGCRTWRSPNYAGILQDDAERIGRLERQVQYLLRLLGVDPEIAAAGYTATGPGLAPSASPEIVALIQAGKPIWAIKAYRNMKGVSLKDAKDAIDGLLAAANRLRHR